jgi:starch synthase
MEADFGWDVRAEEYMDIYHDLHPEIIRWQKKKA